MEWYWILVIFAVAVALYVLYRKGIITVNDVRKMGEAAAQIAPLITGGGVLDKLIQYAQYAFHAAEQLCKIGEIKAEERKETALALVAEYAAVDGVVLTEGEKAAAATLLEANCDIKGHAEPLAETFEAQVAEADLKNMSTELLESICKQNGIDISRCYTREQIIAAMLAEVGQAYDVDRWDTAQLKDFCELNEIDTAGITTDDGLRKAIIDKGLAVPVEPEGAAAPAEGQGE